MRRKIADQGVQCLLAGLAGVGMDRSQKKRSPHSTKAIKRACSAKVNQCRGKGANYEIENTHGPTSKPEPGIKASQRHRIEWPNRWLLHGRYSMALRNA